MGLDVGSGHGWDCIIPFMTPATPREGNRCTGIGGGHPQDLFLPFGGPAIMGFAVCHVAACDRAI